MGRVSRYALASVAVAFAVLLLKGAAWRVTGSAALFSDALESIINVAVAMVAFLAIKVSLQPADADHPFGHQKAEYLSAVLEGALILVAALAIFREAYIHYVAPQALAMPAFGIGLNLAASAINGLWAYGLLRTGRKERSPALIADGRHLLADVVSSGGVVAGVLATVLTGWLWLDALVAALAGIYILVSGWRLIKESVGGLMDRSASNETVARIRACIAKEAEGAIEAHDLRTRLAGPVLFVEFHLVVPARMTVSDAHEICDRIEAALQHAFSEARVTIHVEPENKAKHTGIVVLP